LFQYLDEAGTSVDVRSDDVNAYLREAAGEDVSAKDFRTWAGTLLAYRMLRHLARSPAATEVARGSRKAILAAVRATATRLGNTASVCRQSYIHPAIFDAHLNGGLQAALGSGVGAGVESGVAGEGWASALEDAQAVVEQAADPDDGQTRRDEREMLRLLGSRSGTCRRASRRRPTSPRPARPARGAQARSR
jgi:DNA topoisomerase-1